MANANGSTRAHALPLCADHSFLARKPSGESLESHVRFMPPGMDLRRLANQLNQQANDIEYRMKDIRLLVTQIRSLCEGMREGAAAIGVQDLALIECFAVCCLRTIEFANRNTAGVFEVWQELRKIPGVK